MRPVAVVALAGALGLPAVAVAQDHAGHGAAPASPPRATVGMGFAAFAPRHVDVLAGDVVAWRNDSARTHTVDAADGGWASGPVPSTASFRRRFDAVGVVAYVCTRHPSMNGEVAVWSVLLDRPQGAGRPGTVRRLTGRAALPAGSEVALEADGGAGFAPAGTAVVGPQGTFSLEVAPRAPTTFRAAAPGAGPPVLVEVLDRRVAARARTRARRATVEATVTPVSPGAPAVLQVRIPERFGWWPVARAKVDARSRVRFRVSARRRLPARVVLTLPDGATVVAASPTFHVGHRRATR